MLSIINYHILVDISININIDINISIYIYISHPSTEVKAQAVLSRVDCDEKQAQVKLDPKDEQESVKPLELEIESF